jgi:hypothetical protein
MKRLIYLVLFFTSLISFNFVFAQQADISETLGRPLPVKFDLLPSSAVVTVNQVLQLSVNVIDRDKILLVPPAEIKWQWCIFDKNNCLMVNKVASIEQDGKVKCASEGMASVGVVTNQQLIPFGPSKTSTMIMLTCKKKASS